MRKPVAIAIQIALLAIAYEIACLPVWQYLITIGLVMLACVIGMEHIHGGD